MNFHSKKTFRFSAFHFAFLVIVYSLIGYDVHNIIVGLILLTYWLVLTWLSGQKNKVEEALRASEKLYRDTFEQTSIGIVHVSMQGKPINMNDRYCEIVGYTREELLKKAINDYAHPEDVAGDWEAMGEMVAGKRKVYTREKRYFRKDGTTVWGRLNARLFVNANKVPQFFVGMIEDIGPQKESERIIAEQRAQILTSAKMATLGEMAGGIAHEINTPLALIQMHASQIQELLEESPADLPTVIQMSKKVELASERISRIIKGLRVFSRDASNDDFVSTSIKTIIETTLALSNEKLKSQSIEIRLSSVPEDLMVHCNSTEISQVLTNLIQNSSHAVEGLAEKWLSIEVFDRNGFVDVAIIDSGQGISPDIEEKMFQPFFTTKEVGKGTGLGLSISMGIAKKHKGDLIYDRTKPNTCFILSLPKNQS